MHVYNTQEQASEDGTDSDTQSENMPEDRDTHMCTGANKYIQTYCAQGQREMCAAENSKHIHTLALMQLSSLA